MKIRTGFVSNSSSSSFIIACKGDLREELERLAGNYKSELNKSPFNFSELIDGVIDAFVSYSEKFDIEDEEQLEYEGYDVEDMKDQYPDVYQKVKHFGWDLYIGSVSDEDSEVGELAAVAMEIDYKDDKIIIHKDSWY